VNIYLCGMIGSGKTTIGLRLAEAFGLDFYDLDEEMDRRLGYSFHRLVQEQGWLAFRELEYSICKMFSRLKRAMVCLGGGTVRYAWNMDVMRGTGCFVLLTAPLDELIRRVSAADRPRVNPDTDLAGDVQRIWDMHKQKYLAAADIVCSTEGRSIQATVDELSAILIERGLLPES
jgi:shikimate kinase